MHLTDRILKYIRDQRMLAPGDRLGLAVSGGADSVALLRLLLELREELGLLLSVVHFNHKIRGEAAEQDQQFVSATAAAHGLELHTSSADAAAQARRARKSLETAARDLRYAYFDHLLQSNALSSIATGHTLDDQAETVLMRIIRGSGTRGLAAISPVLKRSAGKIIRPVLLVRRAEVLAYLKSRQQSWREDASNRDFRHTRNRIRHQLIPLLEQNFNPAILRALSEMAELAREEEECWMGVVRSSSPGVLTPSGANIRALLNQPVALQRRLLRAAAEECGLKLDFEHVEALRHIAAAPSSSLETSELPGARAVFSGRGSNRELRFQLGRPIRRGASRDYQYLLRVPGEVQLAETATQIRASLVKPGYSNVLTAGVRSNWGENKQTNAGYNHVELLDPRALIPELTVRNWQPGDRYWPAHRKSPKKVKELLQNVARAERATWPVVAMGEQIVWMRGFPPAAEFLLKESTGSEGVLIEEVPRTER